MAQEAQPGDADKSDASRSNNSKPDWRSTDRTFQQGEPYGGEDAGTAHQGAPATRTGAADSRLKRLMIAGASMIAASVVLRLVGAGGFYAFIVGIAIFAAILFWPARPGGAGSGHAGRRIVSARPGVDAPRIQADLDKAEAELASLDETASKFERREITSAIRGFTTRAREVLDEIARDPNDAERSRKFLVVILPSARRSAEKFLKTGVRDAELDARFEALMGDLEAAAAKQLETLRLDEKLDLEVEMEVLADRLKTGG